MSVGDSPGSIYLLRDRDTRFARLSMRCSLPLRYPYAAHAGLAESECIYRAVNQSIKHECLDHFLVCGEQHIDHFVDEYLDYCNTDRPHQSIGNEPLQKLKMSENGEIGNVVCDTRLGGRLKHYRRGKKRS